MAPVTLPKDLLANNAVPAAVEELCLKHDRSRSRIGSVVNTICSELVSGLDREERLELAVAIAEVADELRSLIQQKIDAGYFEGFAGTSHHLHERATHLLADYRRLLNELRTAQHETSAGKPRKSQRQLISWLRHFDDVSTRESELISELWSE